MRVGASRLRLYFFRGLRVIASVLLAIVVLVPLAARVALMTNAGRELLRTQVLSALEGVLDGQIVVDRIDHVSLTQIQLSGVRVLDNSGREVASAKRASARVELWPLLQSHVELARIWLESPRIELGDLTRDLGETNGFLDVIPTEPSAPEPTPESEPSAWTIRMRRIDVTDGAVATLIDNTHYAAQRIHARASVNVTDEVTVEAARLYAHLLRDGKDVAALSSTGLRYATTDAAAAKLRAWVGTSQLWLDAKMSSPNAAGTQTVAIDLRAQKLAPAALQAFGVSVAPWNAPVDLKVVAHGHTTALDYDVNVFAREGSARIVGNWHAPGTFAAQLRSEGLALRSVIEEDIAPIDAVADIEVEAAADWSSATLQLDVNNARYAGDALPESHVAGRWSADQGLDLPEIRARYPNARLDASLSLTPDGIAATTVHLRADALEELKLVHRAVPELKGCVELNGSARVPLDSPLDGHVDVRVHGDRLQFKEQKIDNADLRLVGGPHNYVAELDLHERGRVALKATRANDRLTASGGGSVRVGKESFKFKLNDLVCRGNCESVQIGELRIDHAGAVVRLRGRFAPGAASQLVLHVDAPDLKRLSAPWVDPPLEGAAELDATLDGRLARPTITAELNGHVAHISTLDDVTLALNVTAELGPQPVISGDAEASLRFHGDDQSVELAVEGKYEPTHLALRIEGEDREGPLFRTTVSTDLTRGRTPTGRDGFAAFLQERTWDASVWLAARRIADLPAVRMLGIDDALLPARVSAHGELAHVPGKQPEGSVELRAAFHPPDTESVPSCGLAREPVITLQAQMHDGKLSASAQLDVAGKQRARAETHTEAPLSAWLAPVEPDRITLSAVLSDLELADVPLLCERLDGSVSGNASMERTVANQVTVAIDVKGTRMHAVGQPQCFDVAVVGNMDHDAVKARATFDSAQGHAVINATIPIDAGGLAPTVDMDAPLLVNAELRRIELPALLAMVPQVRSRSGTIEGNLRADGTLNAPELHGDLRMIDASILLPELGQPFEHMDGRLVLKGRTLQLLKTRIHDRDGWADVTAEVALHTDGSVKAQVELSAEDLPIRRGGVILARLDGDVAVGAEISESRTELAVTVRNAAVELMPAGDFSGVQDLAEHPEIHFVDGAPGQLPEAAEQDASTGSLRVKIDAREPFWMRRDDFSLLVSTQLTVDMVDKAPAITGSVDIERGVVELIGQSFDVDHGRISFAGGHDLEPTLEIVASHRAAGGVIVTVEAHGTVRDPELRFLVDGAPVTAGEALAAAAGSRTSDSSGAAAEQQIGAMATGLLSGVLTLGARRSLGEWVPVLAIENTETESRLRAGIDADSLIPKFLRPIVVDAYVEGILSATRNENGSESGSSDAAPQTDAAVLLELRFPHNLVGEAQYGPGARWSADFGWEP